MGTIYEIIMQTARCYTKSGSVEKYESNLWESPISGNWSTMGVVGTITTPDSNGNYTVTLGGDFEDSDTPTSYYCFTKYHNAINYFYFKISTPKPPTVKTITIRVNVSVNGYNHNGNVAFSCSVSGDISGTANNTLANDILRSNSISLSWAVVTPAGPFGNYTTSITSTGSLTLDTGANFVTGTQYYINGTPSCSPSGGKYNNEYNWDTHVTTGT